MHIWSLTSGKFSLAAHLTVDENAFSAINNDNDADDAESKNCYSLILEKAQSLLCKKYSIHHSTIQIEWFCNDNCRIH